ncbi:97 kDa heat shock protein [Clonorchis sinensis]|uniref:97 kDa heat shock protein n=1 Tax=Clonorchis sinensis TaxID=79923 RepID=A0A8T1MB25_CLOSI|nr:97 kDa heat shock protein [Clonorchis sinensis]
MSTPVGIYCGDLSSCVVGSRDGKLGLLENDRHENLTPSAVTLHDQHSKAGKVTEEHIGNAPNTIWCFTHLIGNQFDKDMFSYKVSKNSHGDIVINMSNGQKFVVVQLVAMIIGELKMLAEKSSKPHAVDHIVLNTPVFYGERERSSLVMACRIVGIERMLLVDDLMAVATLHAAKNFASPNDIKQYRNVAFVIVEHTCAQVMICTLNKEQIMVCSTEYDRNLGAYAFDTVLLNHLKRKFDLKGRELEGLKACQNSTLDPCGDMLISIDQTKVTIERQTYQPLLDRFQELLKTCLAQSTLTVDNIHSVELFCETRYKLILHDIVSRVFVGKTVSTIPLEVAIAYGCALNAAGYALKSVRTEPRSPFRPSTRLSKVDLIKCKTINKEIEAQAQHTGEVWSRLNKLKGEIFQANSTIASWAEFAYLKDVCYAAKRDSASMDAWLEENKSSRQIEQFDARITEFSGKMQKHRQKQSEIEKVWSSGVESLEKKLGSARTLIQSWSQLAYLRAVYSEAFNYVQAMSEWLKNNKAQISVEDLHRQLALLNSKTEFFKQRQEEEEQRERSRLLNRLNEKLNIMRSQLEKLRSLPDLVNSIVDADTFMASVERSWPQFAAASLSNLTAENLKLDDWWRGFVNTVEKKLMDSITERLGRTKAEIAKWTQCTDTLIRRAKCTLGILEKCLESEAQKRSIASLTLALQNFSEQWNLILTEKELEDRKQKTSKLSLSAAVSSLLNRRESKTALTSVKGVPNRPTSDPLSIQFNRHSGNERGQPSHTINVIIQRPQDAQPSYDELYMSHMGASPTYSNAARNQGTRDDYPSTS